LDDFTQPSGERKVAALTVLRFAWVQSQPASTLEVHVVLLTGENLIVAANLLIGATMKAEEESC
jgi:hypothetical protein